LSFINEKGAALILPYEAQREDILHKWAFEKHMLANYRKWNQFAEAECQLRKGTCLILVTGCDLTRQWATATYCNNNREINTTLGAQVVSLAEAHFSLSAGWRRNQAMNTRQGPPQDSYQQPHEYQEEMRNLSKTTKYVFLHGFYIKNQLWGLKVLKAGAGYHNPGQHGPEEEGAEGLLADE